MLKDMSCLPPLLIACNEAVHPRGMRYPMHAHEFFQANLIVEGMASVCFRSDVVELSQGGVVWMPPGLEHAFRFDRSSACRIVEVKYDLRPFPPTEACERFMGDHFRHVGHPKKRGRLLVKAEHSHNLRRAMKDILDLTRSRVPRDSFVMRKQLWAFIVTVETAFAPRGRRAMNLADRAAAFIAENCDRPLSLKEIATASSASPSHLAHVFKEQHGCSLIQYLLRVRIERARDLLSEGNRSVKEVATAVGYADVHYFSRLFKRMERVSPSRYLG